MNKHYDALELGSVLNMLAQEAASDDAKSKAAELVPAADIGEAELLLSQTEDAFSLIARFGGPSFSGLKNVNNAVSRAAAGGELNTSELLSIAGTLRAVRSLYEWYGHCSSVGTKLDFFFDSITVNKYLEEKIFSSILSEDEIADRASDELYEIRRKMRAKSNSVREKLDSIIHSTHYQKFLQEPIVTQRSGRYVVPVKAEHRSDVPGLVHDMSSSGATVFIEPVSVVDANNEIKILESREREEIRRILFELSAEAGNFSESIKSSYESAVMLDLIFAKARLAYKMKASRPLLNKNGYIDLKKARHPLLDPKKAVPVDISLGGEYDTLVITGPNTGGKTVSIKTIGLLTLMAMCGLLIPAADRSEISVFEKILVDVGDEQSIQQNLSTFSSHMVNIIEIMKETNENSLVLIDELGAGTDPVEGAALAVAIIEKLRSKGAKIAATTHYAELKAYALETPGVTNGSCEFDVETLRPTYRLLIGVPGRSNAFAISEHLGMDKSVIDEAKRLVGSENKSFESVLEKLEETRRELENEKEKAQRAVETADKMKRKAQSEKDRAAQLVNNELEKAKREAEKIISSAKRQSADFLLRLDQLKKEADASNAAQTARKTRREIKNRLGEMEETVNPRRLADAWDEDYKLPRPVVPGDAVIIRSIGEGEVLEVGKSNVLVQSGMLKTRVKMSDLMLTKKKEPPKQSKPAVLYRTTSKTDSDISSEIDLRGKTVDEALHELTLFLDKCVLLNMHEIRIIHGKGTGALRAAVQQELRHHKNIADFRLGVYGEGESGVTIAHLK
ncbi:MAG TPA: endonuclease MutS2 [Candidatus Eubacterium faecavium]|nr:endonuclease MutS2 [Candidatus Eubacterium faecavium]